MPGMRRRYFGSTQAQQHAAKPTQHSLHQDLFDAMSRLLHTGLSVQEALDWLIRQGLLLSAENNSHLIGADALLQALQQQRNQAYSQYQPADALQALTKQLETLLGKEHQAIANSTLTPQQQATQRQALPTLDQLRALGRQGQGQSAVQSFIQALAHYGNTMHFLHANAQQQIQQLLERSDDIARLEHLNLRHGAQFYGTQPLTLDQALALSKHFERMLQLSEALRTGNWEQANPQGLEDLLEDDALAALHTISSLRNTLHKAGWLRTTPKGLRLTSKGVQRVGKNALKALLLQATKGSSRGKHLLHKATAGNGISAQEASKPYQFGDDLAQLHPINTLKNRLRRQAQQAACANTSANTNASKARGHQGLMLEDFEVWQPTKSVRSATVLLLDTSWSMSREGRFAAAKQVALALDSLIRLQRPQDAYYVAGFSTQARQINPHELVEVAWDTSDPFTNLQAGLRLARRLLSKHRAENSNILVITDGQPTAAVINGKTNASWPGFMGAIPPKVLTATLREVRVCTRQQLRINVFMLDNNPILVRFVEKLARINKGRVFYSHPTTLHRCLLVDYWRNQRRRIA